MERRVRDRPVVVDQSGADDARDQDVLAEDVVEGRAPGARHRPGEVGGLKAPAEAVLRDRAGLQLQRPLGSMRDLAVDGPEDREPGGEQHEPRVQREAQDQPGLAPGSSGRA